jgi:alpha-beta hydrolase superfamily lysophospholipase
MQNSKGKIPIISIIIIAAIIYILTAYVAMPIIITYTVMGRVETLDRIYDPPTGTPQPPETVTIQTKGKVELSGWLFPVESPVAWVFVLPDPHRNRSGMMPLVRWLTHQGYGVVAMDLRARGESSGSYLSGGLTEAQDLLITVSRLQDRIDGSVPIVVYGVSTGAVAALLAAAQSDAFDAVVADSPYLKTSDWITGEATRQGWLKIPGLYDITRVYARLITGQTTAEANLDLTNMVNGIRVPVLFLMGDSDPILSRNDMAALRSTITAHTTLTVFDTGYSGSLFALNIDDYQAALEDFLAPIIHPQGEQ